MKYIFFFSFLFFFFICYGQNDNDSIEEKNIHNSITGLYEYVYEYNTEDLIENHYINLFTLDGIILGIYYGTSDDFDNAREGYMPGFFKSYMHNLKITDSSIYFTLTVFPSDFYKKAITPYKSPKKNKNWNKQILYAEKEYFGEILHDKFVISSNDIKKRIFIKRKRHQ